MTPYFLIAFIFFIVWLDVRTLLKEDRRLFHKSFRLPVGAVLVLLTVLVLLFSAFRFNWDVVPQLSVIVCLPLYLIQRRQYFIQLKKSQGKDEGQITKSPREFELVAGMNSVILHWFFFSMIIALYLRGRANYLGRDDIELVELMVSAATSFLILLVLIHRSSRSLSNKGFRYNVGLYRGGQPISRIVWLPAVTGLCMAAVSAWILTSRDVQPNTPLGEAVSNTQSPVVLLLFFLLAVGLAPLIEEIIFRGYFFSVLEKLKGSRWALIIVALSFAVLHVGQYWGDWAAILMVGFLGFLLTGFRAWTGSTVPSTVMHYVYNGFVVILPVLILYNQNPHFFEYQAYQHTLSFHQKEDLLLKAIELDPELSAAYNDLAWYYSTEAERYGQALELAEKALELDPENLSYMDTKVEALWGLKRYDEAQDLEGLIESYDSEGKGHW